MSSSFSLCELCFTELSFLAMILDSLKIEVNILVVFPVEREVLLFFLDKVNIERVEGDVFLIGVFIFSHFFLIEKGLSNFILCFGLWYTGDEGIEGKGLSL